MKPDKKINEGDLYFCSYYSSSPCTNRGHNIIGYYISKADKGYIKCNGEKCVHKKFSNYCNSSDTEEKIYYYSTGYSYSSYYVYCDLNQIKRPLKTYVNNISILKTTVFPSDIVSRYTGDYVIANFYDDSIIFITNCKYTLLFY